jgi:Uma2 family endonuclease
MATVARRGTVSFEEFCVLIRADQKADLIDGVIYMASPENIDANRLFVWLICLLNLYVRAKGLGEVFGSRVAFRLGEVSGPEPDIAFVKKDRLHLARRTFFQGPPDFAIEVVSPECVERDYVKKRTLYETAGVREYWIIDEELQKVLMLRLDRAGHYREVRAKKGVLRSFVVPGFWIRTAWLWQQPRPGEAEILEETLSA